VAERMVHQALERAGRLERCHRVARGTRRGLGRIVTQHVARERVAHLGEASTGQELRDEGIPADHMVDQGSNVPVRARRWQMPLVRGDGSYVLDEVATGAFVERAQVWRGCSLI